MKTSWFCLRCDRTLANDTTKAGPLDTVTAPLGSGVVMHDQCGGGRVAWSQRDLKEPA